MTKTRRSEARSGCAAPAPPPGTGDDALLRAVVTAFELMGAQVRLDPTCDDNLVRRGGPGEPRFVVCAEGLPNLVHELGHVLWFGALEDDHGIDYRSIPYALDSAAGTRVLVEELACSVLSCTYAPATVVVHDWFAEQLEIQPVFYGFDPRDPKRFADAVSAWLAHSEAQVESAVITLHGRAARWLAALGARSVIRSPRTFTELWRRYRGPARTKGHRGGE